MSDDEEMSDMSQVVTQSGSITYTSQSGSSNKEPDVAWGRINIFKITKKCLGMTRNYTNYSIELKRTIDLIKEKTTFGRSGDCNISDLICDPMKLNGVSHIHFTIIKNNVRDHLSPVFLEDSSVNGTYFQEPQSSTSEITKGLTHAERIDMKFKRRILAHKDLIYIEKNPTIRFEFESLQISRNYLPNDINREYHIGNKLGSGACGTVYFAQNRRTCQPFAVKYTESGNNENTIATIYKEIDILKKLQHPCILQLYKTKTYLNSVAIFIDFMQGGDLLTRINRNGHFDESLTKFCFYQICSGIEYLHSQNVIHRDLKPENILLATADQYTLVKVSDFGLSKRITPSTQMLQTQCGTPNYLAPEVYTRAYTSKCDIWSLGVILFNCFTGRYPFKDSNGGQYILTFKENEWSSVTEIGKKIVSETLEVIAERRPSAFQLLNERSWLSKSDKFVQKAHEIISNPNKSK